MQITALFQQKLLQKNIPALEPKYLDYIYWNDFKIRNGFASVKFDKIFKKSKNL